MNKRKRHLMWALLIDIGAALHIISLIDEPEKGPGTWTLIVLTVLVSIGLPIAAWYWNYRKSSEESPRGFNVGDKVLVEGERGVLLGHPLLASAGSIANVKTDLNLWIVRFEDGSTREDVHDIKLKRPGAITLLGDLVRLVHA